MVSNYPYKDQEQLQRAYAEGQYRRGQGWDAQPLRYVGKLMQSYSLNYQEEFYGQIVAWYLAGYNGQPLQCQNWA